MENNKNTSKNIFTAFQSFLMLVNKNKVHACSHGTR